MEKIKFKYHLNVWEQDVFTETTENEMLECECCGKLTQYYLQDMYSAADVDCICPKCVANGSAAEKFDGEFVQYAETEKVSDEEKRKELFCRTPGYVSWQGEYWLACCNDFLCVHRRCRNKRVGRNGNC